MDSPAVHKAATHMLNVVEWDQRGGTEWTHAGLGTDFKEAVIQQQIDAFFSENQIYLILGRKDSLDISTKEAARLVRSALAGKSVTLWDHALTRAIHFNRIGVFKCGKVSA